MAPKDQMPPWIYSDGFWANLRAVMFPHRWLAARTAGVDLTKALDAPEETVSQDGAERVVATGEDGHANRNDQTSPDSIGSDSRLAANSTASFVTRRHGHIVNGHVE